MEPLVFWLSVALGLNGLLTVYLLFKVAKLNRALTKVAVMVVRDTVPDDA